jgi:hypothetical protein
MHNTLNVETGAATDVSSLTWYTPCASAPALDNFFNSTSSESTNGSSPNGTEPQHEFTDLLQIAAKGNTGAQYNLAIRLDHAVGMSTNKEDAFKWYRLAATNALALTNAQYNLACCYDDGIGTDIDPTKAVYWYEKAAASGHRHAQCNLGYCYEHGTGIAQSDTEAARLYRVAAEPQITPGGQCSPGVPQAQFNLGSCFLRGKGVAISTDEALQWFELAASTRTGTDSGTDATTTDNEVRERARVMVEYCRSAETPTGSVARTPARPRRGSGIALVSTTPLLDAFMTPPEHPTLSQGTVTASWGDQDGADVSDADSASSADLAHSCWSRLATRGTNQNSPDSPLDHAFSPPSG